MRMPSIPGVVVAMLLLTVGPATAASLKDFGAKCDGRTDDTAAIQKAVASLAPQGGTLTIPRAKRGCLYSSPIVVISNLRLVGEGSQGDPGAIAPSPSTLRYLGTGSAITCGGVGTTQIHNISLEDFTLEGSLGASAGIAFGGIPDNFCVRAVVRRVTVRNFLAPEAAGMLITAGVSILVDAAYFTRNYHGVVVDGNAGTTTLHFRDVGVRTNLAYGYLLKDGFQNLTIDGSAGVIESNGSSGIRGDFSTTVAAGLTIRDVFIGNSNMRAPEDAQVLLTTSGQGSVWNVVIDHVYFGDAGSSADITIQAVWADIRNILGAAKLSHPIVRVRPGSYDVRCHQIITTSGGWVDPACVEY